MQYAIHCSIRFHQNVHKHWILALGHHSFDMCSTRPHQTLVPCVFINVFSQVDQLTHLASGLELRWIPWYSNTLNETFALFFLLYSRLHSFVITTVFALLFKLFQFHSFKTLNLTLWWRQNLILENFVWGFLYIHTNAQTSSDYLPWFPVSQWKLVGVPNYTPLGVTGRIPGIHGEISDVTSFWQQALSLLGVSSLFLLTSQALLARNTDT